MHRLWNFLVCIALVLTPQVMCAQEQIFRGHITIEGTQAPLIGALVQLRRQNGDIVAATTTSESGNFSIAGLVAGPYRVRILRIGFRPFDAGPVTVASVGPAILNVAWSAIPIPLAARLVRAERACKISADSGTLIANVWEETRKALLSSMIAEQSDAPEVERVNFERYVDTSGVIIKQDLQRERSNSFRAYASWAPESLAVHGYVSVEGGAFQIIGPDATTLVSDAFAGSHCFAVVEDTTTHASDIGLAFTPLKSTNRERVDIAGTFWMDRTTWALRSVDYRYEGGLFAKDSEVAGIRRAGGFVEFGALASGPWLVTNWRIRRPILDATAAFALRQRVEARIVGNSFVVGIDESGGMVTKISYNNTVQMEKILPSVSFQVVSRDPFVKLAGAQLRIGGLDTVFTVDQTGKLRLVGMLDGTYAINASFPSIASFAPITVTKQVAVRGIDVLDTVDAPSAETVARARCGPKANLTSNSALLGTLTLKHLRAPGVYLVVEWPIPEKDRKDERTVLGRGTVTNADGRFLVCDVPRGPVAVRASVDVATDEQKLTLNSTDAVQQVEVNLLPSSEFESRLPSANVEIQLLDASNNPLSTRISVTDPSGRKFAVTTDKMGWVLLPDQPVGLLKVLIKNHPVQQELVPGYNLVRFVMPKR